MSEGGSDQHLIQEYTQASLFDPETGLPWHPDHPGIPDRRRKGVTDKAIHVHGKGEEGEFWACGESCGCGGNCNHKLDIDPEDGMLLPHLNDADPHSTDNIHSCSVCDRKDSNIWQ